jgi:CBS domain-containing protein
LARPQTVTQLDTVREIMTTPVFTISPTDSLLKTRDRMTKDHVSQLVVIDQRSRPIGFISKREIARFLLEDETARKLEEINVSEASPQPIPTIRMNLPVFNAARMFDTDNLAYTVVTNDKPLAGIVTETDLCRYFGEKSAVKFKVSEFMSSDFIFAKSTYPIIHVAQAIVYRQPGVPVIDEELVGMLTLSDLLAIRERAPKAAHGRLSKRQGDTALITTKDLMTKNPVTVPEDMDLVQTAQLMIKQGVSTLPVLDEGKKVVGLLTKHDIVRALGRAGTNMEV